MHRFRGQATLFLGRIAHCFELLTDRTRAGARRLRNDACDLAGAGLRRLHRFLEQAVEPRQPLVKVGGAQIKCGDEAVEHHLLVGDRFVGLGVALLDQMRGFSQQLAVRFKLRRERVEVAQRPLRG